MVDKIEIQNISLPSDIQRAMATEAEESKRSKAKVNLYILLSFSSDFLGDCSRRGNACFRKLERGS